VNVIGLSWCYLASQAVSQLGRYQCEYKFTSFYFTILRRFLLSFPPLSSAASIPLRRDPELTALICFELEESFEGLTIDGVR